MNSTVTPAIDPRTEAWPGDQGVVSPPGYLKHLLRLIGQDTAARLKTVWHCYTHTQPTSCMTTRQPLVMQRRSLSALIVPEAASRKLRRGVQRLLALCLNHPTFLFSHTSYRSVFLSFPPILRSLDQRQPSRFSLPVFAPHIYPTLLVCFGHCEGSRLHHWTHQLSSQSQDRRSSSRTEPLRCGQSDRFSPFQREFRLGPCPTPVARYLSGLVSHLSCNSFESRFCLPSQRNTSSPLPLQPLSLSPWAEQYEAGPTSRDA